MEVTGDFVGGHELFRHDVAFCAVSLPALALHTWEHANRKWKSATYPLRLLFYSSTRRQDSQENLCAIPTKGFSGQSKLNPPTYVPPHRRA
jgi:hypothetical protein